MQSYACKLRPAINPKGRLARLISTKTTWLYDAWLYRNRADDLVLVQTEHNGRMLTLRRLMWKLKPLPDGRMGQSKLIWNEDHCFKEVTLTDRWVAGHGIQRELAWMHKHLVLTDIIKPSFYTAKSIWLHYIRLDEHTEPIPSNTVNHWMPGRGVYKAVGEVRRRQYNEALLTKLDSLIKN